MENLGLYPARYCPECGEEFGEHKEGCGYSQALKDREARAKKALSDFGPETIDDILSLVDMRECNSLHGDMWRQVQDCLQALDSQIFAFEMPLEDMRRRRDYIKKLIKKVESAWLGEQS